MCFKTYDNVVTLMTSPNKIFTYLEAHGPQLRGLDFSAKPQESHFNEGGDEFVDVVALALALQDDHFE